MRADDERGSSGVAGHHKRRQVSVAEHLGIGAPDYEIRFDVVGNRCG
jgi:hypothetical protein